MEHVPLFTVENGAESEGTSGALKAVIDGMTSCYCIVVGSLSSLSMSNASLLQNGTPLLHSQLCRESGRGAHSFHGVINIKEKDLIKLTVSGMDDCWVSCCGHLAIMILDS